MNLPFLIPGHTISQPYAAGRSAPDFIELFTGDISGNTRSPGPFFWQVKQMASKTELLFFIARPVSSIPNTPPGKIRIS